MLLLQSDYSDLEYDLFATTEPNLFALGGYLPMSIVTLLLVVLILAAWKAPAWVKEIGLIALALGFLWTTVGLIQHANIMQFAETDEDVIVALNVIWAGLKCHLIPVVYCILVYIVSLVICIIKKIRELSVRLWVKDIGVFALAIGLLWIPIGLIRSIDVMLAAGDISSAAVWSGVKSSLIPFASGLVVYIVSLIISIIKKPRS